MIPLTSSPTPRWSERPQPTTITANQLRSMWRTASRERGWSFPDDWWTPAVDAVTEAVLGGGDVAERCARLGRARGLAGVPMHETLSDVQALVALVRSLCSHPANPAPSDSEELDEAEMVRSAAVGWSEHLSPVPDCGGPGSVTALADCAYLSIRLGEVAAEAETRGHALGAGYAFVVASLLGPTHLGGEFDPTQAGHELPGLQDRIESWDHAWQMNQLADDLRTVFRSGETLVQTGPTTALVLARRTPAFTGQVAALRTIVEGRRTSDPHGPHASVSIWVEGLPASLRQARQLLADLRR